MHKCNDKELHRRILKVFVVLVDSEWNHLWVEMYFFGYLER